MAAKKTATKKTTTGSGKSATASATTTTRKVVTTKATKSPAAESTAKTTPKAATKPAPKVAAKKPLKLSDAQEKILRQIDLAGETGYAPANKTELRSIEKLREVKLVKRGAKDKATGNTPYMTSAAGKKHLASQA